MVSIDLMSCTHTFVMVSENGMYIFDGLRELDVILLVLPSFLMVLPSFLMVSGDLMSGARGFLVAVGVE